MNFSVVIFFTLQVYNFYLNVRNFSGIFFTLLCCNIYKVTTLS